MPTIPDVDMAETGVGLSETNFDLESENVSTETSIISDREDEEEVHRPAMKRKTMILKPPHEQIDDSELEDDDIISATAIVGVVEGL